MNINQLKLFYLAIKRKSLSNAAAELNITQPAVTKGIQRLQEYYEIKFVERPGKKLELTQAGAALYEIADKIFSLEKLAEETINSFRTEEGGLLRIHASESFGGYYLPALIYHFKALNPAIRVKVDILPTDKIVETTIGLQNEIGFISYPVKHERLIISEVLKEKLILIVSPGHQLATMTEIRPRDLEGQAMIMHEHGSALQMAAEKFLAEENVQISSYLEFSNNEAIKRAVEGGTGIALLSKHAAREEIKNNQLVAVPLTGRPIIRKFYLISHKDKYLSGVVQTFIDMIFDRVSRHEEENTPS